MSTTWNEDTAVGGKFQRLLSGFNGIVPSLNEAWVKQFLTNAGR